MIKEYIQHTMLGNNNTYDANESAIVGQRIEEAIKREVQRLENSVVQYVLGESKRLEQDKAYHEKMIVDATNRIEDSKKRLETIDVEAAGIPERASKKREMNEVSLKLFTEECKETIKREVRQELERAERARAERERAEWASNV